MQQKKKILFLIGAPNQTIQMHKIASKLPDYDCYFSLLYSKNPLIRLMIDNGILDTTILGTPFKNKAAAYLKENNLKNDYAREVYQHQYDMAVLCSDMLVTNELRKIKTVWVQEGMTDPMTNWGKFTHQLKLPAYLAGNTAFNGCSNICDIYCAASAGYKQQFSSRGTDASKIFVTGIPNYDDCQSFYNNDFPYHNHVLVASSDIRETFKYEDREKFIEACVKIANGRQLIFKLHPNELKERAISEIKKIAPANTVIFSEGNTAHMIANCEELITQYSTVVYIGIALGKRVHSFFDVEELKRLAPIQNGGRSAAIIAALCRQYLEFTGYKEDFIQTINQQQLQYA